ncbi:tetratricopeptide repeat protein [Clostridium cellulovorans]|uniref:Tetratricopeptide TPR_1 repeat-containing protein n=1 Tax=Clostridium cellulovorans (strain ATCC 35296 / DSM 3052 / OCM 3 / 743B) TaxID=573061 RepID=D9SX50_CLOC7|nr:tetratricopeptide repeat protein [Clostridium cellulovorans]ADL53353.1 Tetratricopeptide TPR_1 repeat-containing protein [Clostridium cellulovorans 743B]
MSNSKGYYDKAITAFSNGQLDKALMLCEKSISLNLKNQAALNLKGLIYYLQGELASAKAVWKTNNDYNDNSTAKEYLRNIKLDEALLQRYRNAVKLINDLRINDAIVALEECAKSSFNNINVLNALGLCMMKKGEYDKSKIYFERSLEIDKKNKETLEYIRRLEEFLPKKFNLKKTIVGVVGGVAVLAIIFGGVNIIKGKISIFPEKTQVVSEDNTGSNVSSSDEEKAKEEVNKEETSGEASEKAKAGENIEVKPETEDSNSTDKKVAEDQAKQEVKQVFNSAAISQALAAPTIDYDNLYALVEANKDLAQGINDKNLLNSSIEVLKNSGCEFFYNRSQIIIDEQKNYSLALDSLNKALQYSQGHYLRQHILYFIGFSYDRLSDFENASKFYDNYIKEFPSGNYELAVLYRQCVIFKDIDAPRAKIYANEIHNKYQGTSEDNSVVQEILSK